MLYSIAPKDKLNAHLAQCVLDGLACLALLSSAMVAGAAGILSALMDLFGQGMVIVYPPVIVFWLILHTNIDRWRRLGKRAYWIAAIIWALISLPLLFYRETVFSARWPMPWWIKAFGLAAFVTAAWFGSRARQVIPFKTLVGLPELEPEKNIQPLLQTGVYGRTRNPVYLTHTLLVVAAVCFTGYVAAWALLAFDALFLPWMIRAEERELRKRYGNIYADYMARVPRFLPRLW